MVLKLVVMVSLRAMRRVVGYLSVWVRALKVLWCGEFVVLVTLLRCVSSVVRWQVIVLIGFSIVN